MAGKEGGGRGVIDNRGQQWEKSRKYDGMREGEWLKR